MQIQENIGGVDTSLLTQIELENLENKVRAAGGQGSAVQILAKLAGIAAAAQYQPNMYWKGVIAPQADQELMHILQDILMKLRNKISGTHTAASDKLTLLRQKMKENKWSAFWVPLSDAYQGEYIPYADRRLEWLTGFSGSAGSAIVLADKAAFFTDGRYEIQAPLEVDRALYAHYNIAKTSPVAWLKEHLKAEDTLAYDPWLHTHQHLQMIQRELGGVGCGFVAVSSNPIDQLWQGRPVAPISAARPHPVSVSGRSSSEKRSDLCQKMQERHIDALCLSAPDSVAWLLNIRGEDIDASPYCLSRAILYQDGTVDWFVNPHKIASGLGDILGNDVLIMPEQDIVPVLQKLATDGKFIQADPGHLPARLSAALQDSKANIFWQADPVALAKACKNETEISGSQAAHRRDGVAVIQFMQQLETDLAQGHVLTELDVVDRLFQCRQKQPYFRDVSFNTIAGAGPNGAITHYRVSAQTNRVLEAGSFLLVDSGGQYLDGTTDITRCFALGTMSQDLYAEISDRYTRVLKGHLALRHAHFPIGTTGSQLDSLARQPLWQAGLDYDHGTGHGVGSYLSVHEGPQRISKMPNKVSLQPGMIVSNEPGYYAEGRYGIRIENLIVVSMSEHSGYLTFEDLTCVPYDRRLIRLDLLSRLEREQIDAYHHWVYKTLADDLESGPRAWVQKMTSPLI